MSFLVLAIPLSSVMVILLLFISDYKPIYKDPLYGQAFALLAVACLVCGVVFELRSSIQYRKDQQQKQSDEKQLSQLAGDADFIALYGSEGEEGDRARERVSALVDSIGGWPNESTRLIFDAKLEELEKRRSEPLNARLGELLSSEYFNRAYYSSCQATRNICDEKVNEFLDRLGESLSEDNARILEEARERRRSLLDEEYRARQRVSELNRRLRELMGSSRCKDAIWRHDLTGIESILNEAKPIVDELGESADAESADTVRKLSALETEINNEHAKQLWRMDRLRKEHEAELQAERDKQEQLQLEIQRIERRSADEISQVKSKMVSERKAREKEDAKRRGLARVENERELLTELDGLDGWSFESRCAELLKLGGYSNVLVTRGSGDQGIDVIAERDGVKYGFQCKNYSGAVGNGAVKEALVGKRYYGCHVAVVLTNSHYTQSAIDLARKNEVVLWDRNDLLRLIRQAANSSR